MYDGGNDQTSVDAGAGAPLADPPLAGIRVLEFGYGVAAPVCCRNLAQYGADVIRVESTRRPDSLRQIGAGWVPLSVDWAILRDTGSLLNFTCPGKRSIGLELDHPAGRDAFDRLVAASDAVVMNMSVEAVDHLGLGYDRLRQINPELVWMNMPSFGSADGPYRTFRTWGRNISALAGLSSLVGWPDRDPVGLGVNLPDYLSALWGTTAVVAAILERDATGEGCEIDLSQYQAALSCLGPTLMEAELGGSGLGTRGNRSDGVAPEGVYPCRGDDRGDHGDHGDHGDNDVRWVALSVLDEHMWQGLCGLVGPGDLPGDARFSTSAGRLDHHDDLDQVISRWTATRTPWEAAAELQAVGVAASPVLDNWDVLMDPQLRARQHFRVLPHPRFDRELSYGQAITLSETPATFTRAAPAFGQDTRTVLAEVADLGETEIHDVLASGAASEMEHTGVHLERPYLHWIRAVLPLDWPPSTLVDPPSILFERLSAVEAQPDGDAS
jgi:benzylsuccinate CoA-transferase BbsF subunit